jgi:hypothetical protein
MTSVIETSRKFSDMVVIEKMKWAPVYHTKVAFVSPKTKFNFVFNNGVELIISQINLTNCQELKNETYLSEGNLDQAFFRIGNHLFYFRVGVSEQNNFRLMIINLDTGDCESHSLDLSQLAFKNLKAIQVHRNLISLISRGFIRTYSLKTKKDFKIEHVHTLDLQVGDNLKDICRVGHNKIAVCTNLFRMALLKSKHGPIKNQRVISKIKDLPINASHLLYLGNNKMIAI